MKRPVVDYEDFKKCPRCHYPMIQEGGTICLGGVPFPWKESLCATCVNDLVKHLELPVVRS